MRIQRQLGILIQSIFLACLLLGCSQNNSAAEITEFLTYEDKNNNFSINYPSGWSVDTSQKDVNVMFDSPKENEQDVNTENLSVTRFPLPQEATSPIENYKDGIIDTMKKQNPGFEIVKTTILKINNQPALQIVYTGKRNNLDLKFEATYLVQGKTGYILTFTSLNKNFDKYSSTVDRIINSFNITK